MILIGTVHFDLDGPERLEKLLTKIAPRNISIEHPINLPFPTQQFHMELQRYAANYFNDQLLFGGDSAAIKELYLKYCAIEHFESFTAVAYAEKHNISIFPVDSPIRGTSAELANCYNVEHIARRIYQEGIDPALRYTRARFSRNDLFTLINRIVAVQYGEPRNEIDRNVFFRSEPIDYEKLNIRDEHMQQEIHELLPDIHIGGIGHTHDELIAELYDPAPEFQLSLHQRIAKLITERIRLCDGDAYEKGNPRFSYFEQRRDQNQLLLWNKEEQ